VVALLLFFFYLGDKPRLVLGLTTFDLMAFALAYEVNDGFGDRVPVQQLTPMGWASILAATVVMAFMAVYYVSTLGLRSELEKEAERHRATAVRLRRAKLAADSANLARSIFLAKMSHEFRTPLNAVIGYSELLVEQGEDTGADEQKLQDLRRINAAGRRLLALVTDVLDLSRIESRAVDMSAESFPLHELLAEVTATAQPLVEANGNRLTLDGPVGAEEVTTDRTKLGQVLLNLLSNAGKFTKDGEVVLRARLERRPGGDWLDIAVEDTGIGMTEDEVGGLFQDFAQANAGIAGRYGGTGLGLSVSQKLCALMGGAISVQSRPGVGSTFTVRLPAALSADALAA
jgi:signal transduction histidine kinase